MVPTMLFPEQKEAWMLMASTLIELADADEHFLGKTVNGDETWKYLYDSQTKHQSTEWKTTTTMIHLFHLKWKKKFHLNKSKGKVILDVFLLQRYNNTSTQSTNSSLIRLWTKHFSWKFFATYEILLFVLNATIILNL